MSCISAVYIAFWKMHKSCQCLLEPHQPCRGSDTGVPSLTCGIGVAALHILECAAAVDDQVLGPSAEMHKVQGAEEEGLYDKVSVADSVHGVGAHPAKEPQLLSYGLPVHPKGIACQRTCKWTQA